jgi:hypothetical protein
MAKEAESRSKARPRPQPQVAVAGGGSATIDNADESAGAGMPEWLLVAFPLLASVMFHVGIAIVIIFAAYVFIKKTTVNDADKDQIIIPVAFQDPTNPGGVPHPGENNDASRDAAQNMVKTVKAEGFSSSEKTSDVSKFLSGPKGDTSAALIAVGGGGGGGGGDTSGGSSGLAPFGTPGGGSGSGPKAGFYGTGGNASKVVIIIDRSGSMLDVYDDVKAEAKHTIDHLIPLQSFAVVTFSDVAEVEGPGQLLRAIPSNKKLVLDKLMATVAEGNNDDTLIPYSSAFEKAFAMHPQLIFFLTDGAFDPQLYDVINKLNANKKVSICTFACDSQKKGEEGGGKYTQQLEQLAKDNGGKYQFIKP